LFSEEEEERERRVFVARVRVEVSKTFFESERDLGDESPGTRPSRVVTVNLNNIFRNVYELVD
jgi:hypothetical protein